MKLLKKEVKGMGSSKKVRILFATSKEELEILSGIAEKACALFPVTILTEKAEQQLRNMVRNFKSAFKNWNGIAIVPATDSFQDAIDILNRDIRIIDSDIKRTTDGLVLMRLESKKQHYVEAYDLLKEHRDNNTKINI